jgi:anthraniloyl-CoA monooxygenase
MRAMRIVSIGGGPAGLYFAILMKQADPSHEIVVVERNGADDTFGFGVVFSDATLSRKPSRTGTTSTRTTAARFSGPRATASRACRARRC